MARTTKAEVEAVFERLCVTVGVPVGGEYARNGAGEIHATRGWSLDHNGTYGGWTVRGHSGDGTGQSNPLGHFRLPAGQFVQAMHVAIQAVYAARELS